MSKAKSPSYPEIEEIKEDLNSLKDNVIALTQHIQKDGKVQAEEVGEEAKKRLTLVRARGKQEMKKLERQVKAKPGQSMAIAFAAGLAASALLRGRR